MSRAVSLLLALLLLSVGSLQAQETLSVHSDDDYMRSNRFGINHISGVEEIAPVERYQNALALGAGWNRWPIYWDRVEAEAGTFDWSGYDRLVRDDMAQGLQINAILLGRPAFYADGNRIQGLQEPIYADGSDTPGPDKALNPKNPWVHFVQAAVERYRPGGELAATEGWRKGEGIRVWEIWNEPDHKPFWSGSIGDYARLLKTAYLVIKQVDPELQVMFGGLLYPTQDNWLARVLAIFENDPFREANNWYMDAVAVHNYSYPWRSGWLVNVVDQTLIAYKLKRPIWLNESGVPVWDDYPGPVWAASPAEKEMRATSEQQAEFFIQSSAYALAEGAEVIFYHQLYDDCGNQPAGTDFPYRLNPVCKAGEICFGDAFGMYRNERGAVCFRQHPAPGTARPITRAYQLVTALLGEGTLEKPSVMVLDNRATVIRFDRPESGERLYVVWNITLDPITMLLPVSEGATSVRRYSMAGEERMRSDGDGVVTLELPTAACDYFPFLQALDITAVGGETSILVVPLPATEPEAQPALGEPLMSRRTRCPQG